MKNGDGVAELQAAFADRPDLVFRHFEDPRFECLRWQCGREVCDVVELSSSKGIFVERFELLAWAATSEQLIDKLAAL